LLPGGCSKRNVADNHIPAAAYPTTPGGEKRNNCSVGASVESFGERERNSRRNSRRRWRRRRRKRDEMTSARTSDDL